jgi:hypothetical protein
MLSVQVGVWVKLSFQCLRPSASLRAAGKKDKVDFSVENLTCVGKISGF